MQCGCSFADTDVLGASCGAGFALFMALVETVLQSRCEVADPCGRAGRDSASLGDGERFDVVVVGAGVAGSVVAARLAEKQDWRVLLLEAGPEEPTATQLPCFAVSAVGGALDWNYTTVPQRDACLHRAGVCKWPRGKMVAGTGAMNGMMYTRGHRAVFDEWATLGNQGWAYDDVLPYFKMSENNLDRAEASLTNTLTLYLLLLIMRRPLHKDRTTFLTCFYLEVISEKKSVTLLTRYLWRGLLFRRHDLFAENSINIVLNIV